MGCRTTPDPLSLFPLIDAVVGKVLEAVDDQTLLIVLSDHGFNSFRAEFMSIPGFMIRTFWLLRNGIRPGEDAGDLHPHVDWQRTKAYALGLSGIYLNLKNREDQGIVSADESAKIKTAIANPRHDARPVLGDWKCLPAGTEGASLLYRGATRPRSSQRPRLYLM